MQFDLILRNDKIKTYRIITLILVSFNILYFGYTLFDNAQRNTGLIALGTLTAYAVYRYLVTTKKGLPFYIDEWVFFVLMLLWVDNYYLAILNLLLMLLYTAATQEIRYEFSESILQKNFPWKKYSWNQFSNVVLKDNILTLDFLTERIIQSEIKNDIDETAFNRFASSKLLNRMVATKIKQ